MYQIMTRKARIQKCKNGPKYKLYQPGSGSGILWFLPGDGAADQQSGRNGRGNADFKRRGNPGTGSSLCYTDRDRRPGTGSGQWGVRQRISGFCENLRGGSDTLYNKNYKKPIDPAALENFLREDHNYKYATLVHCDTPSGMLNDVGALCPVLKKYGILTVVDSVSAMFGNPLHMDAWGIDFLCGGSQKALSAPPGLTFVSVSRDGKKEMDDRKTPVASFYANLKTFDGWYEKQWFPYTMPISDIYGLRAALDNLREDTDLLGRHRRIAEAVRRALVRSSWHSSGRRIF